MNLDILKNLRHNFIVNIMDGAFFGFAMGFASFVTVIPLFVSSMTNSATLIGLVPAIHNAGWQLPQMFLARRIAMQKKIKPMVLVATIQERLPFLGMAIVAWLLPRTGIPTALVLTFLLLIWQGLGAGLTANPWQSMIAKIIPSDRRGTFLGSQAAAANLLASLSAVLAGVILEKLDSPMDFTYCFLLCSAAMVISYLFLGMTREPASQIDSETAASLEASRFWSSMRTILARDHNFRWFLVARSISFLSTMGFAFYTVYAVNHHGVSKIGVGWMTSTLLAVGILGNAVLGWIADRWNRKAILEFGLAAAGLSALLAWWAPAPFWFYLVFALTAVANVTIWTIAISVSLEFGSEAERPAYVGMANTLIAPANILAPFLGGWLADTGGYPLTFLASAACALAGVLVFHFLVREPGKVAP